MRILITTDGSTSPEDVHIVFKTSGDRCIELDLMDQPELSSTILDALGLALLHRGLVDIGRPLIESSLGIRRESFGDDHPATALSLNSYARARRQSGDFNNAETEARKALAINSRTYGGNSLPVALNL